MSYMIELSMIENTSWEGWSACWRWWIRTVQWMHQIFSIILHAGKKKTCLLPEVHHCLVFDDSFKHVKFTVEEQSHQSFVTWDQSNTQYFSIMPSYPEILNRWNTRPSKRSPSLWKMLLNTHKQISRKYNKSSLNLSCWALAISILMFKITI